MFKTYTQGQGQLLPPNLDDFIGKDHIARLCSKIVDDLDLSQIEATYSLNGQHAYHPAMLLKILVYGYIIGMRSSRKLDQRLHEDVVMMWLSGRQTPDFRTIALFRKEKLQEVKGIFEQVLDMCIELGMIRVGKVSIDGTKVLADAAKNRMQYRKLLEERKKKIAGIVDDILKEAEALDEEEEKLYGNLTPHQTGLTIEEVERRLKKIKKRKETLKRHEEQAEAKKGDIQTKLRKMRKDRNSMSSTDKDATMMMMKEGYIAPGYNVQVATEHQVILAYGVYPDRNDQRLLKPMIQEVEENTGRKPSIVIADAGYGTKMNYRFTKNKGIAAFIPYNNYNKEMIERNKGIYQLPQKVDVELERYKFKQRLRLTSKEGKEMMARRREDVEPTIGDLKRNMGFRRFNMRGRPRCLIELGLLSIGHNMKKIKTRVKQMAGYDDGRNKVRELGQVLGYLPV